MVKQDLAGRRSGASWRVVAAGALSLVTTLVIWQLVRSNERVHIQRTTQLAASAVQHDLADDMEVRILGQVRLAKLWEFDQEPSHAEWKANAGLYIQHHPGCIAIEWLQPTYEERWVVRAPGDAGQAPLISDAPRRQLLEAALQTRQPAVSPAIQLPDDRRERMVAVPIYHNGQFRGLVIAFFDVKQSLDTMLEDVTGLGYSISVSENGAETYRLRGSTGGYEKEWGQSIQLPFPGVTWQIRVWPKPEVLNQMWSHLPAVTLIAGLLLGLLVTSTVYFAQKAAMDSAHLQKANQNLLEEVAERQRTEQALRASRARLSGILEMSPDAVISVDQNECITLFNRGAEKMFGYEAREILGRTLTTLIPKGLREPHHQHLETLLELPDQTLEMATGKRLFGLRKGGPEFPIEASVAKLEIGGERVLTAMVRDVTGRVRAEEELRRAHDELEIRVRERTAELAAANTALQAEIGERKLAEESLRELSGRLLQLQDEERRRIARELHDGTTQSLVALSMELAMVRELTRDADPTIRQKLNECVELVDQCSGEIRTVSYLLHPPLLDELGLGSTLRNYVEGFGIRSGINVNLKISPDLGRLPRDVELAIFRIVQESLTNIHRHSQSRTANLLLHREAGGVELEIGDQGRGLPPGILAYTHGPGRAGVGLAGMRERVLQLGGQFQLDSGSAGTAIRIRLPAPARDSSSSAA